MANDDLKKTAGEIYADAIMEHTPVIIVEGKDDVPFYDRLCNIIKKKVTIYPIDVLKEHSGHSCDDVIRAVKSVEECTEKKQQCQKYLLGIIDRDARFFRGYVPDNLCILILKYYSYESHLINRNNIKQLVQDYTSIGESFIDNRLISFFERADEEMHKYIYYACLEALKGACTGTEYNASVGYSKTIEFICKNDKKEEIMNKKTDLDDFASEKDIAYNDESFKTIVKGHWFLRLHAGQFLRKIQELPVKCKNAEIQQCQYCKIEEYDLCLYKKNKNIQINDIENSLIKNYDYSDVDYIKDRIMQLA
ncbi:hypothetical protein [Anaerosporobacter sp.]|uniref:hypothetical protein n=1 Tax=Anaerosporobacter sp. TaxID=1872529 RepID=UPI00286F8DD5|nr:hypothetical protein [Anaerosporobacter sp.]